MLVKVPLKLHLSERVPENTESRFEVLTLTHTLWVWSELVIWGIHVFGPQFPQQSQMVSVCVLCQCYEDKVDQIEYLENSREPGMVAHACHLPT